MKSSTALAADVAIGLTAGLLATSITGPVQKLLDRLMPPSVKRRERQVRPGPPTKLAAEKLAAGVDAKLSQQQLDGAATAIHYASGLPWGVIYAFLRRHSGMTAGGAALATGTCMSIVLDEALTPAFGFAAPDREYPTATHVRGFVSHLAFGAVAAATAEALYRLTDTGPDR
jgi:uncharacterized membrane protein YagU involved in acid resistance